MVDQAETKQSDTKPVCKIRPLMDIVIVYRDADEEITQGGVIIPDNAKQEKTYGEVLATGPGLFLNDGMRREMDINVGQRVIFSAYGGTRIDPDEPRLIMLKQHEIFGVVEG